MKFYYWNTNEVSPYRNLAIEQKLMDHVPDETVILFLWQNHDTIVIGRNQDVNTECRADEFLKDGGQIARRMSGGGAVYHDRGNVNYSIICRAEYEKDCQYHYLLKKALSVLTIDAEYNDRNDLTVQGKKISGNAVYVLGDIVCQHGTVLVATDIQRMSYYLTPDVSKLSRNKVKSVKSRVENISVFDPGIGVEDVKQALIKAANAEPLEFMPDMNAVDELTNFYGSTKWIFGGER